MSCRQELVLHKCLHHFSQRLHLPVAVKHWAFQAAMPGGPEHPGENVALVRQLESQLPGESLHLTIQMWAEDFTCRAFLGGQRETGTKKHIGGWHGRKGKPRSYSFTPEQRGTALQFPLLGVRGKAKGSGPGFSVALRATWT